MIRCIHGAVTIPVALEFAAAGGDKIQQEIYAKHDIHQMDCFAIGPETSGWFKEEIKDLEQLRGLKMRFFGLGARVMQKIGVRQARMLFLTGERFDAAVAERIGLVHRCVPVEELDAAAQGVLDELTTSGPVAMGNAKELIQAVDGLSLEDAIPVTSKWIAGLRSTPEAREGMSAFLEKRKPSWVE